MPKGSRWFATQLIPRNDSRLDAKDSTFCSCSVTAGKRCDSLVELWGGWLTSLLTNWLSARSLMWIWRRKKNDWQRDNGYWIWTMRQPLRECWSIPAPSETVERSQTGEKGGNWGIFFNANPCEQSGTCFQVNTHRITILVLMNIFVSLGDA